MAADPLFSVVLATYNRGRHLIPTIESVLRQTCCAYELIVVGDGCNDCTEEAVASFKSERITWRNLPRNSGSQSLPNNEGLQCARGAWICYIGHDDIWAPDHLAELRALTERDEGADFAVSGCICYGPPGSEIYWVTGMFAESEAALEHFFPRPRSPTGATSSGESAPGAIRARSRLRSTAIFCCARRGLACGSPPQVA